MQHELREIPHGYEVMFREDEGEPAYISFDVTYIEVSRGWGLTANVMPKSMMPSARRLV